MTRIEVTFPATERWYEDSALVQEAVGVSPAGAGIGFVERDMEFRLVNLATAKTALARVEALTIPGLVATIA